MMRCQCGEQYDPLTDFECPACGTGKYPDFFADHVLGGESIGDGSEPTTMDIPVFIDVGENGGA